MFLVLALDDISVLYGVTNGIDNFLQRNLDLGTGLLQGALIHICAYITDSLTVFVINSTGADYAWNIFSAFGFSSGFAFPVGIASLCRRDIFGFHQVRIIVSTQYRQWLANKFIFCIAEYFGHG